MKYFHNVSVKNENILKPAIPTGFQKTFWRAKQIPPSKNTRGDWILLRMGFVCDVMSEITSGSRHTIHQISIS